MLQRKIACASSNIAGARYLVTLESSVPKPTKLVLDSQTNGGTGVTTSVLA